ncbi:MAG: Tad domain-containing protein [Planctomycetales bacterium]
MSASLLQKLGQACRRFLHAEQRFHDSEEGTMAQVTVIVVMGFAMLVGMVGNVGRIVQKKVAVQNAADAVAYSTALWQARSYNAVTAINHMLGEVTAICVLHEAIGGPELDDGQPQNSDEFRDLNRQIKDLRPLELVAIHIPGLFNADRQIVDLVRRAITFNEGDDGRTLSGATLYDARVTLKKLVMFFQDVKVAGNILIDLGKIPILAFLVPIGVAMHAVATPILIKCGVEAGMLLVLEAGAEIFVIPKRLLENQLIPLLAKYPADVVKKGGSLSTSITSTVQDLESRHSVQASIFPAAKQISLALVEEPGPKTGAGGEIRSQSVSSGWPGDIDKILSMIKKVTSVVNVFNKAVEFIPGAKEITGWAEPQIPGFDDDGSQKNFSRETVKKVNADWNSEEITQWTRATYPWVDSLRAPIIGGMKSPAVLQLSKAGVYYGHWTNRFTIAKSHAYRSGTPLSKTGGPREKQKMFIMKDMKPDRKGKESWTTDSPEAEKLFTVQGFTTHRADALFSPAIFGGSSHDQVVYAQAMVYNANPQQPSGLSQRQQRVGWDTLNWTPPVNVPEYGTVPTERSELWPPWSVFEKKPQNNTPGIKLNWQAKLVPVTRSRLGQAANGSDYKGNIKDAIQKSLNNTRQLDTH